MEIKKEILEEHHEEKCEKCSRVLETISHDHVASAVEDICSSCENANTSTNPFNMPCCDYNRESARCGFAWIIKTVEGGKQ